MAGQGTFTAYDLYGTNAATSRLGLSGQEGYLVNASGKMPSGNPSMTVTALVAIIITFFVIRFLWEKAG